MHESGLLDADHGVQDAPLQAAITVESLLDVLNDAVIVIDAAWRIVRWNAAAEAIYGWAAGEVCGRSITAIIPTVRYLDGSTQQQAAAQVLATGVWRGVVIQPHRDGSHRYIDASIRRLQDAAGLDIGMVAVNRDVTERQQAAAQLTTLANVALAFQTATDSMPVLLQTIVREAAEHIGDGAVIRLVDAARERLLPGFCFHRDPECQRDLTMLLAEYPQDLSWGPTGQVIQSAAPFFLPVWQRSARLVNSAPIIRPYVEQYGLHSCIIVPLSSGGQVIGTLNMVRDQTKISYTIADLHLLQELAHRASLVIERTRLLEAERISRAQLEALHTATQAFMDDLRLDSILKVLESALRSRCSCEAMALWLFNDQGGLAPVSFAGLGDVAALPAFEDADLERILGSGQPLVQPGRPGGPGGWAALPLMARGAWIGILQVAPTCGATISAEEIHYGQALSAQAAVAIDQARLLHDLAESKGQLSRLAHQLVTVQEGERARLARELHDGLGQALTGLKLHLETTLLDPAADWAGRLDDAKDQVIDILSQVRQLSLDIRPAALEDLGLFPSLRWLLQRVGKHTGVWVTLHQHSPVGRLPAAMELALYRVVQESVTNIVRHAGVTEAVVHVWATPTTITLLIQDRGCGFDATHLGQEPSGLGLVGMRERIAILGGTCIIDTAPGQGTSVTIDMPCGMIEEVEP